MQILNFTRVIVTSSRLFAVISLTLFFPLFPEKKTLRFLMFSGDQKWTLERKRLISVIESLNIKLELAQCRIILILNKIKYQIIKEMISFEICLELVSRSSSLLKILRHCKIHGTKRSINDLSLTFIYQQLLLLWQ